MVLSLKKATQKSVLCKFKTSILNKELPIISKMSEPDKRGHGMLGADSKTGEKNVTVELTPPAKAGPENLKILPLIINPYTHRHKLPESNIKHNRVALTKKTLSVQQMIFHHLGAERLQKKLLSTLAVLLA